MCVPSDYISSSCPERRHRGTLMVGRSSNSLNLLRALMVRSSCNISSRSNPEINILCSKILARTTNGVANPRGSNSLTIFMRKFRFISGKSFSGGFTLKVYIYFEGILFFWRPQNPKHFYRRHWITGKANFC